MLGRVAYHIGIFHTHQICHVWPQQKIMVRHQCVLQLDNFCIAPVQHVNKLGYL